MTESHPAAALQLPERLVGLRELHMPAVRADQMQVLPGDAKVAGRAAGAVADPRPTGAPTLRAPDLARSQEGWIEGTERSEGNRCGVSVSGIVRRHLASLPQLL